MTRQWSRQATSSSRDHVSRRHVIAGNRISRALSAVRGNAASHQSPQPRTIWRGAISSEFGFEGAIIANNRAPCGARHRDCNFKRAVAAVCRQLIRNSSQAPIGPRRTTRRHGIASKPTPGHRNYRERAVAGIMTLGGSCSTPPFTGNVVLDCGSHQGRWSRRGPPYAGTDLGPRAAPSSHYRPAVTAISEAPRATPPCRHGNGYGTVSHCSRLWLASPRRAGVGMSMEADTAPAERSPALWRNHHPRDQASGTSRHLGS